MEKVILTVGDLKEFLNQFQDDASIKTVFSSIHMPELGISEIKEIVNPLNSKRLRIIGDYID